MEELRITANGLELGALAWGEEGAPLALLLHGFPDTAHAWRHVGPGLAARGWRAVAPFTRGYAPTGLAPDGRYRLLELAQDALALEAQLRGSGPSVVVGHDWGALTVHRAGVLEPGRFAAWVTLSVPPAGALLAPWGSTRTLGLALRQGAHSWYIAFLQLPGTERLLSRVIPRLWRDWSPGYDGREDARRALAALAGPGRRHAALGYYRDNLQRAPRDTFLLKPVVPVLHLHGEHDGCMEAALVTELPGVLPAGSRVEVLPGVGHFLPLEAPDAVLAHLDAWLPTP